jgi:hypothetical protein
MPTRAQALQIQAQNGVITMDEGAPTRVGTRSRTERVSSRCAAQHGAAEPRTQSASPTAPASAPPPSQRIHSGFRLLLTDAAGRAVRREVDTVRNSRQAREVATAWRLGEPVLRPPRGLYLRGPPRSAARSPGFTATIVGRSSCQRSRAVDEWEHQAPLNLALALTGYWNREMGAA